MAVGDACTVGQRAKINGFWYACTATNVWTIVQPTCTECGKYTGGTLAGNNTFLSTGLSNGAKIAGDYPATGTRYCYVYNSTTNTWEKKTDSDCGENASGGAWYGCTAVSCKTAGQTCTSANRYTIGDCCEGYCIETICTDYCGCIAGLNGRQASGIANGTKSCDNYCTVVLGYWSCQAAPEC